MSTPENKLSVRNYDSPGISKTLLTPCRRIGLSRTRKTPKNLNKTPIPNNEAKFSDKTVTVVTEKRMDSGEIKEMLDNNSTSKERKRKISNDVLTDYEISPKSNVLKNVRIAKGANKDGGNNKGIPLGRFTTEEYLEDLSSNFQPNHLENETFLSKDISSKVLVEQEGNDTVFQESPHKISSNIVSDGLNVNIPVKSEDKARAKKIRRSLSTKKPSIELKKLSQTVIPNNKLNLTVSLEKLSKELISNKRENIEELLENIPSTLDLPDNEQTDCGKNKLSEIPKECDDDDDDFASSPKTDKQKRENLLKLIALVETEINHKEEKLNKLKQAEVYKRKHSPEKLKISSDRWIEGCRASLNDLLIHLQSHGPMEMNTLLNNLRIPVDIVEKLKLQSE